MNSSSANFFRACPNYVPPLPDGEWSLEENMLFENAVAEFDDEDPDYFENIASRVPGKTIRQIETHFRDLIEDVDMIENGIIPVPDYGVTDEDNMCMVAASATRNKPNKPPRKRGIPWTAEEHELFLKGLETYGKGDWRSISRNSVVTRTPSQVASHAQKYFLRLQNSTTDRNNSNASDFKSNRNPTTASTANIAATTLQLLNPASETSTHNSSPVEAVHTQFGQRNDSSVRGQVFAAFRPHMPHQN